jgi:DNA mismatch repair ATPase MutL
MIKIVFQCPARRKFLKPNTTELKTHICEMQRVALANPGNLVFIV